MLSRLSGALLALSVVATLLAVLSTATPASAVTASQWQAGNIISDAAFYNPTTLNAAGVQSFFNSVYSGCSTGYTCIRDYKVSTPARPSEPNLCNGYAASSSQTAAQIIAGVAVSCGVNPQALIVLIQKESGDITSTTPGYQQVTGYGCPDSTGCDAKYYGFFNQVYLAARQFKLYRLNPNNYGYVAGTTNYILYNPNTACGGSQVYITNQATAGLYDYTPYQPNAAALANLHGTGNSCSAYGNRNFWVYYNSWFGATQAVSYLVHTQADPTVYFVNNGSKYPIDSWATLTSLPPAVGTIGTVTQTYLDSLATGPTLGRFVIGPDGQVYLFDTGTAYRATSCTTVVAYGVTCLPKALVPLPAAIISSFTRGAALSQVVVSTSGTRYYITAGTRREVLDDQSLTGAGISTTSITLNDGVISGLTLAAPLARDNVTIQNPTDGSIDLYAAGKLYPIASDLYTSTPIAQYAPIAGQLSPASIALLSMQPAVTGFAADGAGNSYVVNAAGKTPLATPASLGVTFSSWPTGVLSAVPTGATATTLPMLVKVASSPNIYAVSAGTKYLVNSWTDAQAITQQAAPAVVTMLQTEFDTVPTGSHSALLPGAMVKSASGPGVYLIDGLDQKLHIAALSVAQQLNLSTITVVDDTTLAAYTVQTGDQSPAVTCNGVNYLVTGGAMRAIAAAAQPGYGFTYVPLDPITCRNLAIPVGAPLTGQVFARTSNSTTVYQITGGLRHPVTSWRALLQLTHGATPTIVFFGPGQLDSIPLAG